MPTLSPVASSDPELAPLLAEREAYLQTLYPERAGARRTLEALADHHGFYGLRLDGRIVGCGGLISHPGFMEKRLEPPPETT